MVAANDAPKRCKLTDDIAPTISILPNQRDLPIATLEERLVCHERAVEHHPFPLCEHMRDLELAPVEHEDVTMRADLETTLLFELEHVGRVARDQREKLRQRQSVTSR